MPVKRGPDGKPEIIDTNVVEDRIHTENTSSTNQPGTDPLDTKPTDLGKSKATSAKNAQGGERSTRIFNPEFINEPPSRERPFSDVNFEAPQTQLPGDSADETYVCGWLVVVDGPGKGKSVVVGPGQSAISRSAEGRIRLNFGDMSITSKQQLIMFYDDVEHEFIVSPGNGSSLNRLNGQLITAPVPIKTSDFLKVGSTTLRFVAFCDKAFNWTSQ